MVERARRGHRLRSPLVTLAAVLSLNACTDQAKVHEDEMTGLLALLPGRYANGAQVEEDVRTGARPVHDNVALVVAHVYSPRLGHHIFYAQEMAADDPRRVLSQKMYGFDVDEKRGIVETVYELVDPLRWRDGQLHAEMFTAMVPEDVQAEGCQLLWKKTPDGFIANHDPKVCPDPVAAGAPPQAALKIGALTIGDYKFRKAR